MCSCTPSVKMDLSWVSSDVQYTPESNLPDTLQQEMTISGWLGERIGAEALMKGLENYADSLSLETVLPDETWKSEIGWVRYVLTNEYRTCGSAPDSMPAYQVADLIDFGSKQLLDSGAVTPIWCALDIPRDAKPGTYKVQCNICANGKTLKSLNLNVNVVNQLLPEPHDYKIHLDLWQQPYSVSRYYNVKPWSDEHFNLLHPYMQRLARAGQKVVSAILFYEPWGKQSNDKFQPMVETTRHADGTWSYDYTVFDKWVNFMAECGIDRQIDCYSMVPWDMSFRYWDETTSSYQNIVAKTTDKEYKELWTDFLIHFAEHLREQGWFEKTCIAMDERGLDDMLNAYKIAQDAVPGLKMSLAGVYHPELAELLYDYCLTYSQSFPAEVLSLRKSKGYWSTCYTCCSDSYPSLFSNAAPVESTFIPLISTARGFDGFLHWSWLNWTDDPKHDTRFKYFAPGDTYFFYPDNSPSIHWERFLDGVQQAEKVRALGDYSVLDALLDVEDLQDTKTMIKAVNAVKEKLNKAE